MGHVTRKLQTSSQACYFQTRLRDLKLIENMSFGKESCVIINKNANFYYFYFIRFLQPNQLYRAAHFANFERILGFFCSVNQLRGGEVMQITMQRARTLRPFATEN